MRLQAFGCTISPRKPAASQCKGTKDFPNLPYMGRRGPLGTRAPQPAPSKILPPARLLRAISAPLSRLLQARRRAQRRLQHLNVIRGGGHEAARPLAGTRGVRRAFFRLEEEASQVVTGVWMMMTMTRASSCRGQGPSGATACHRGGPR